VSRALALAALLAATAAPLGAQYAEPFPRRPGVTPPLDRLAAMAAEAERLGFAPPGTVPAPSRVDRRGTRGMVVIPALFADSPEPFLTAEEMQAALFDGPSPRGTVGDFYSDQSGGVFTIAGEVLPWVRTSVSLEGAAGTDGTFGDSLRAYVSEAIRIADEDVDFGRFDNDGADGVPNSGDDDGTIDGISVQFLEVAGSCGGPGIWPHLGGLAGGQGAAFETGDLQPDGSPIRVQVYIADSAVDCSGERMQGPEVMVHEIGHLIGLPDYYRQAEGLQPWQRHWAVGCFDTMGAGSWGCGTGVKAEDFGPTGLSALSRATLGWATLEQVGEVTDVAYTLDPLQEGRRAIEIPLSADGVESFIVEYRPRVGYDEDLPAGGVLVYHRDRQAHPGRWIPPGLPPAYGYQLVEADGDDALVKVEDRGGNRGAATDVFAQGGAVDSIVDGEARPSTRDHLGRPTRVRIHEIRVENGVAHVRVSTTEGFAVASRDAPPFVEGGRPFTMTALLEGGALPLEVTQLPEAGAPTGVSISVDGRQVTVAGTPLEPGALHLSLRIRDGVGHEVVERVSSQVVDPGVDESALAAAVAGVAEVLPADEAVYFDNAGNRNGRLDVGDVRAALVRAGVLRRSGG
jgi:M6 family metalloprotease-like protein